MKDAATLTPDRRILPQKYIFCSFLWNLIATLIINHQNVWVGNIYIHIIYAKYIMYNILCTGKDLGVMASAVRSLEILTADGSYFYIDETSEYYP